MSVYGLASTDTWSLHCPVPKRAAAGQACIFSIPFRRSCLEPDSFLPFTAANLLLLRVPPSPERMSARLLSLWGHRYRLFTERLKVDSARKEYILYPNRVVAEEFVRGRGSLQQRILGGNICCIGCTHVHTVVGAPVFSDLF